MSYEAFRGQQAGEHITVYRPEVVVLPSPEEVDQYAATHVLEQVTAKPNSVLTLPTGGTPRGMYELLVQAHRDHEVDFSQLIIFNLDEYWPIQRDHPSSYTRYMNEMFYSHVNIPPSQRFIPNGEAPDAAVEADLYETLFQAYGPPDLAVIGIGPGTTCHIGFNERGSAVDSRSRYMPLDPETRAANSQLFANPAEIPQGTITQGVADILEAHQIMLLAKGDTKAWGIQRALNGPIGPDAPASYLRYHPQVTFVLDKAAAQYLPGQ